MKLLRRRSFVSIIVLLLAVSVLPVHAKGMMADADYTESYYTTAAEQAELDRLIDRELDRLNLWNASDYTKAAVLYDFVVSHVKYDFNGSANDMLRYTAYGALTRGLAVCQGHATLYYMMARKVGLDAPVVIGTTSQGKHAWNIVKIDGWYYGLDAAWDSVYRDYGMNHQCFLKGERSFDDHVLDAEYKSNEYRSTHALSEEDYVPGKSAPVTVIDDASYQVPETVAKNVVVDPITKFSDVSRSTYYAKAVEWAYDANITKGVSDHTFAPNAACTRAQLVVFLHKALGSPKASATSPFQDVNRGDYYFDAVNWAYERGITDGIGNGTFGGDFTCTRAQAVTILYRAASALPVGGSTFADVPDHAYYRDAVNWAHAYGITSGTGNGNFSPDAPCSRAQIVMFLYNYMNG